MFIASSDITHWIYGYTYPFAMANIIGSDDICGEVQMPKNEWKNKPLTQEYEEKAKNLLKAELKRHGLTYATLAERLKLMGLSETDRNLANKISRGGFSAAFLLQCLEAAGCQTVILSPV